jgi:hypothetical protein
VPGATQDLKEADGKSRFQRTETGYKADCVQASGHNTVTLDTSIGDTAVDPVEFAEGAITYLGRSRTADLQQRGLSVWQQARIRFEKSANGIVPGKQRQGRPASVKKTMDSKTRTVWSDSKW